MRGSQEIANDCEYQVYEEGGDMGDVTHDVVSEEQFALIVYSAGPIYKEALKDWLVRFPSTMGVDVFQAASYGIAALRFSRKTDAIICEAALKNSSVNVSGFVCFV